MSPQTSKTKSKTKPKPKAAKAKAPDPDRLSRGEEGAYTSEDERFEVRDGGTGWFVTDAERTNDFGQNLILGPYATLKIARAALPDLREAKIVPLRRPARAAQSTRPNSPPKSKPKPKPKPKTWINDLSKSDAVGVRAQITALEKEGINDAEALVRRDRDGLMPAIATRLIERDLDALADELPEPAREGARQLIHRAAEIITASGANPPKGLPGWALIEHGPKNQPTKRRIVIR